MCELYLLSRHIGHTVAFSDDNRHGGAFVVDTMGRHALLEPLDGMWRGDDTPFWHTGDLVVAHFLNHDLQYAPVYEVFYKSLFCIGDNILVDSKKAVVYGGDHEGDVVSISGIFAVCSLPKSSRDSVCTLLVSPPGSYTKYRVSVVGCKTINSGNEKMKDSYWCHQGVISRICKGMDVTGPSFS